MAKLVQRAAIKKYVYEKLTVTATCVVVFFIVVVKGRCQRFPHVAMFRVSHTLFDQVAVEQCTYPGIVGKREKRVKGMFPSNLTT